MHAHMDALSQDTQSDDALVIGDNFRIQHMLTGRDHVMPQRVTRGAGKHDNVWEEGSAEEAMHWQAAPPTATTKPQTLTRTPS